MPEPQQIDVKKAEPKMGLPFEMAFATTKGKKICLIVDIRSVQGMYQSCNYILRNHLIRLEMNWAKEVATFNPASVLS
jgi:hypothetical protein